MDWHKRLRLVPAVLDKLLGLALIALLALIVFGLAIVLVT